VISKEAGDSLNDTREGSPPNPDAEIVCGAVSCGGSARMIGGISAPLRTDSSRGVHLHFLAATETGYTR